MSSDPPGRYQSRLFNFLNRQSLRLTERMERAVRQLKVAAVWGAQILVYPVYLLVQASLSAGRQLSAKTQAGWPQLTESTTKERQKAPPTTDTPIQQVLSEVNAMELQIEELKVDRLLVQHQCFSKDVAQVEIADQPSTLQPSTSSNLQPVTRPNLRQTASELSEKRLVVQGVASLLATRTLVLITVQNEILDILTPQQQQKLSSRISWEVADLLRQRRVSQLLDPKTATRRLATLDRPGVFLPVRLFWQVMAWVQTSPVAISANLFQESTLVERPEWKVSGLRVESSNLQPSNLPSLPPVLRERLLFKKGLAQREPENAFGENPSTPRQGVLAFLDRTFTELESHQLVPGSEVVITWSERAKRALSERTQKLLKPLQTQSIKSEDQDVSSEVSQTNTVGIQALIYAAIDYFFGRRGSSLPGTSSQEQSTVLANSQGEAPQLSGRHANPQLPGTLPPDLELDTTSQPDPWLTWGDLFGRPDVSGNDQNSKVQTPNPKTQGQLPEAFNSKVPIRPRNSVWRVIKSYLSLKQPPGNLSTPTVGEPMVKRPSPSVQTAKLMNRTGAQPLQTQGSNKATGSTKHKTLSSATVSSHGKSVLPAEPAATAITTPSSNTDLEPAPDWIETSATPNGYVKHPLERLLESVDLAMLWLEELAVKVWQWVQQLGRRG